MEPKLCEIIEIKWEGPFTLEDVKKLNSKTDYGLYQIYGTHNIFGPESLLYIGKSERRRFGLRFYEHEDWIGSEYSEIKIFVGRLGDINNSITDNEWERQIDLAEKLLIYHCKPPYNSKNLNQYPQSEKNYIVLNFNKFNRLPLEVSTLREKSNCWVSNNWKPYEE
jgi:hypothetical protein